MQDQHAEKITQMIFENIKREYAVLSCILNKPDLMLEHSLHPDMFHNEMSRGLFSILEAFKTDFEVGEKKDLRIDILKAADIAKAKGLRITEQEILDCKNAMHDSVIDPGSFSSYVDDLNDIRIRIKLLKTAENMIRSATSVDKTGIGVVFEAMDSIGRIEEGSTINEPRRIADVFSFQNDLANLEKKKVAGIEMGFPTIDDAVDGLQDGSLTVVGARAKAGKSAFGLNVALNVAKKYGIDCPILYLDTEMSGPHQKMRALSILSGVDAKKIRRHDLCPFDREQVRIAEMWLDKMPIYHMYIPNVNIDGIVSLVRRMKSRKGIGLLVYDYIKLPDPSSSTVSKNMQEYQLLGMLTNALKNKIAGNLNIPVLTFGQLNRSGVQQSMTGDIDETSIGGSDRIIQYCSTYMVLRRPGEEELKYQPKQEDPEWKKMGLFGNRFMHILATRDGGDSSPPIPIYFQDNIITMRESKVVLNEENRRAKSA